MNRRRLALYVMVLLTALAVVDLRFNVFDILVPYNGLVWSSEPQGNAEIDRNTPKAVSQGKLEITKKFGPGDTLFVTNYFGSIEVTGSEEPGLDQAAIDYTITVYADTTEQAEAYLDSLEMEWESRNEGLSVKLREHEKRPAHIRGVKLNVNAKIPAAARVDLKNGYGTVRVENVDGPSKVYNRYNETVISNVRGNWRVDASYSAVDISNVVGDLNFTGSYGPVELHDIDGNVEISADYRELRAEHVKGNLRADVGFGDLDLAGIGGELTLDCDYSGIDVEHVAGNARVRSNFGDVRIVRANGDIRVDSKYGDARVELGGTPDHKVELLAKAGGIRLGYGFEDLAIREDHENEKTVEGSTGAGSHTIEITTQFGDIYLNAR